MKYLFKNLLKSRSIDDYGFSLFISGVFFLPSTLFIGIIFLLPAGILGIFLNKRSYLEDKWNLPFLTFGIIIFVSTFLQNFVLENNYEEIWDPTLSILGMGNWLPFIWLFWAVQPYLDSKSKRRIFGLTIITGSFPILISGFGQYFLNWTGPFETLNGLIVWYQRPIVSPGGLTGLFNNQNYAGAWLNLVWPFCISLSLENRNNIFRKLITFSFLFSVGFAAFLTFSRNAWLGLLTSLPIILGKKIIRMYIPIAIYLIVLLFLFSQFFNSDVQTVIKNLFPEKIYLEFSQEGYKDLDINRIGIFSSALNLIKLNPLFGIGAASFSPIFLFETTFWKGHSHNLLLELAISYGLPATIIFFCTVTFILLLSFKLLFLNPKRIDTSLFDKAFWASLFFFLISQLVDIQYFDGKISTITWILLAGLKKIIEGKESNLVN